MNVFKNKHKGHGITRTQALEFKPVKNNEIKETRLETGEVLLAYPVVMRPWVENLMRRLGGTVAGQKTKKLQLDELGTAVWELIDGKHSVQQVIQRFAKKYQLHSREAEVAVTRFLRDLGKRGLIGLQ
jgi:hypothetical protein